MRAVVVLTGLLLAAAGAKAQQRQNVPTCRAERRGEELITRISYPDGYSVEGPWRVTGRSSAARALALTAVLDRIVETRAYSGRQQVTELPNAVQVTFRGSDADDLLTRAAGLWCETVMQARPPGVPDASHQLARQNRIM